jgi:hypothetical protein
MTEKKRMALISDFNGNLDSAKNGKFIIIYEGMGVHWKECSKIIFSIDDRNISEMRLSLENLCEKISDCSAIIGTSFNGMYYRIFDKHNLKIIEIDEFKIEDLEYLEGLIDLESVYEEKSTLVPISPYSDGNYIFDLVTAQSERPDLSSKMLLVEFFNNVPFISFELTCEHVPPWIEKLANEKRLEISITSYEGKKKAMIRRICIADNSKR